MFCKSMFVAFAVLGSLLTPMTSLAQDAGVSGIPRGPGSVGGQNNSINDPSGRGNAIAPPPPPGMAAPVAPSGSLAAGSRLSSRSTAVVRIKRGGRSVSRRYTRRGSARAETRSRDNAADRKLDRTLSICRGC
jgi:hypothetical protein